MSGETVTRSFTFNTVRDADILDMLDRQDRRHQSALVRHALRSLLKKEDNPAVITTDQIVDACREAIRLELAGRVVQGDSELIKATPESEAAKSLAALDDTLREW